MALIFEVTKWVLVSISFSNNLIFNAAIYWIISGLVKWAYQYVWVVNWNFGRAPAKQAQNIGVVSIFNLNTTR